jgi:hypothetical protein
MSGTAYNSNNQEGLLKANGPFRLASSDGSPAGRRHTGRSGTVSVGEVRVLGAPAPLPPMTPAAAPIPLAPSAPPAPPAPPAPTEVKQPANLDPGHSKPANGLPFAT